TPARKSYHTATSTAPAGISTDFPVDMIQCSAMAIAVPPNVRSDGQHLVLRDVSWDLYEHMLQELGDTHLRMTYDNGTLEMMSPLPKHERWGSWIGRLIELMCLERSIEIECLGSTTFANKAKKKGFEPDKCYY